MSNVNNSFILFFSLRFLKPKWRFIPNVSALMSSLAIIISIAILIIVTSVMNGFTADLIDKILGLNSHITLYSRVGNFKDLSKIRNQISEIDGVKLVFPVVSGSGMVLKNNASAGVFIKCMTKQDINGNEDLKKSIVADFNKFKGYSIILGNDIARNLNLKKGDKINMIVPIVANTIFGVIPRQVSLEVVGFIRSGSQQYDGYMAILPFKTGQEIFNIKNNASSFEIVAKDPNNLEHIEKKIMSMNDFYISDWKIENSSLINALKVEANVMSLILGLFVVISVFTIFAVIRLMIKSKERDIAILKAHGVSNFKIGEIFFIIGVVICISGMLIGNICGILFALNVDKIRLFLEGLLSIKLFDGNIYLLSHLPSRVILSDILNINIFVFFVSLFCIYFSIKRNLKIDITKTLRNN